MTATPAKYKGPAKTLYVRSLPPSTREFLREYMERTEIKTLSEAVRSLLFEAQIRHLKQQHGL